MNRVLQLNGRNDWLLWTFATVFLWGVSDVEVSACNPAVPVLCQAHSRADAVFVGTLIKVETVVNYPIKQIDAHFEVEKVYKGKTDKIEVVRFKAGDCDPQITEIGEKYFVYKEPFSPRSPVANMTGRYIPGMPAEKYAASLSQETPIFTVSGQIFGISDEERKKLRVIVRVGKKVYRLPLSEGGYFEQIVRSRNEIIVKVELPYFANVHTEILKEVFDSDDQEISYSLQFAPNDCDFRTISVTRIQ